MRDHVRFQEKTLLLAELVDDLNRPLELLLLLGGGLRRARAVATSSWAAVLPFEVIAAPCDGGVHAVDVFRARRAFSRDFL
jgi:hypothetical protein